MAVMVALVTGVPLNETYAGHMIPSYVSGRYYVEHYTRIQEITFGNTVAIVFSGLQRLNSFFNVLILGDYSLYIVLVGIFAFFLYR